MEKRKGTKFIKEFPLTERVVGMIEFNGAVFVATWNAVYKMIDEELIPLDIVIREETVEVLK